jgi:tetratricopeptide (TPR) repeat protein
MARRVEFIGRDKELKIISELIKQRDKKHILFLQAHGGIGKTRFLQEVENRYTEEPNVVVNRIIDRDNHTIFSIKTVKESIINGVGTEYFVEYLELEKQYAESPRSHFINKKMNRLFIEAFNLSIKEKKFIFFIDTAEKITSKKFWREAIEMVTHLKNILVIISGREIKIGEEYQQKIEGFSSKIRLKAFSEEAGKLYFEKKSQIENIKPLPKGLLECLIMLSAGKPILLDLTAEWILEFGSRDAPEKFISDILNLDTHNCKSFVEFGMYDVLYEKQREFEKSLVINYENISDTTLQIITLLSYIPLLDLEMLSYILNKDELENAFNRARDFVFTKDLQNGYISLHDEMRRLLNTHVMPRIDADGRRREHDKRKIIPYFEKKIEELRDELNGVTVDEYERLIRLKRELNSNVVKLVGYLFSVDRLLDKAMSVLEEEFFGARYRSDFRLMKALIRASSTKNMSIQQQANYIRMKAESLSVDNKNIEAKHLIEQCKIEHKESLTKLDIARLDNMLAGVNTSMGDLLEAKNNQSNAFNTFKEYQLDDAVAPSSNHLGVILRSIGCLDKALIHHKEALKYGKESLSKVFKGHIFDNMAEIYREKGEFSNALDSIKTAMALWKEGKSIKSIARGYITFGNIYRDRGEYDISYNFYQKAKDILNKREHLEENLNLNINIGKFYWFRYEDSKEKSYLEKAKKYCLDAEELARENYHNTELVQTLSHLSNIYWDEKNAKRAKETLIEFYILSKEHSLSYYTVDAILGFIEFGYEEGIADIQHYIDESKEYEDEYNFPHFFARVKKYEAHILFDKREYTRAIELYAESLLKLSEHGGYSKYSIDSELDNLSQRLEKIGNQELLLKAVNGLSKIFKQSANRKLIDWSENKLLQIEYGV